MPNYLCRAAVYYTALFLVTVCCTVPADAEELPAPQLGIATAYGLLNYSADFRTLNGIVLPDSAENFTSGDGSGVSLGLYASIPLSSTLHGGITFDYAWRGGTLLSREEPIFIVDGSGVRGLVEHEVEHDVQVLGIGTHVGLNLTEALVLRLGARADFLLQGSYVQSEAIVSPQGAEYVDGGNRRTYNSGEFTQTGHTALAIEAALAYRIALDKDARFFFVPEGRYQLGLTDFAAQGAWREQSFVLAVGLRMRLPAAKVLHIDTLYERDTTVRVRAGIAEERIRLEERREDVEIHEDANAAYRSFRVRERYLREIPQPAPLLLVGLDVHFAFADGRESGEAAVVVDEYVRVQQQTLWPFLYFDSASARIPDRYLRSKREALMAAGGGVPRAYFFLLDTLARRMQRFPQAGLRLRGLRSADEIPGLDTLRARSVYHYLVDSCGIPAERLLTAGGVPANAAPEQRVMGRAGNRCVLFESDSPHILAPITETALVRRANTPMIHFHPEVFAEADVDSWELSLFSRGALIHSFSGKGAVPDSIVWNWNANDTALNIGAKGLELEHRFAVRDGEGHEAATERGSIRFEYHRSAQSGTLVYDTLEHEFVLLFQPGSAQLRSVSRDMLDAAIAAIGPGDSVVVVVAGISGEEGRDAGLALPARERAALLVAQLQEHTSLISTHIVQESMHKHRAEDTLYREWALIRVRKYSARD